MRSSILLASALAMGALAGPIDRRVLKTVKKVVATVEVDIGVKVDQNGVPYTTQTLTTHPVDGRHGDHKPTTCTSAKATSAPAVKPTTSAAPAPKTTSTTAPAAEVTYAPAPAPSTSSSVVPPAPTTSEAPAPAPTTSSVYVQPSTSTQAPASSTAAAAPSSAPDYGVTHESGEIQATFSEGQDYINAVLWHHNRARANHGASNLEWSEDCVAGAEKAAATCVFEHLITDGQGQNLYATSGDAYNVTAGITDAFYKAEADLYTYWGKEPPHNATNPEMLDETIFHAWGHLTQVLWKETTHVGCKTVNCPSMGTNRYTVCNYYPAGNVASQFAANVAAPDASYAGYSWLD